MLNRLFAALFLFSSCGLARAADAPHVLFITVDDMSADSIGAFGCPVKGTSPNVDTLASQGLKFQYAHVQVGNCKPSRNVMLSGRYPHNNKVEGFYSIAEPGYPHLCDLMKARGYFAAIHGKVSHSTPYHPYAWDSANEGGDKKSPDAYYEGTKQVIAAAKKAGKPFFLNINISDPHKPFYSGPKDKNQPSKVFTAEDIVVPGFIPDDPVVRKEVALYYSSVRRADDCVGKILQALDEAGLADRTLVMFLSDHGMPLPFAKTALWHHSTHTPWIVRWPGVVKPGTVDADHMISAVDFTPTILEAVGAKQPEGIDGRSFLPLLRGKTQKNRDYVIKEYNENAGAGRNPMRAVQTKKFLYLFNPWSDGVLKFKTATTGTATYRRMKELAPKDAELAARVHLFDYRVVEELYDIEKDPDALVNLAKNPEYEKQLTQLRGTLESWMKKTGDHALEAFEGREDPAVMAAYVAKQQEAANARRGANRKNKRTKKDKAERKDKPAPARTKKT